MSGSNRRDHVLRPVQRRVQAEPSIMAQLCDRSYCEDLATHWVEEYRPAFSINPKRVKLCMQCHAEFVTEQIIKKAQKESKDS